jgi:hypothetical protein
MEETIVDVSSRYAVRMGFDATIDFDITLPLARATHTLRHEHEFRHAARYVGPTKAACERLLANRRDQS